MATLRIAFASSLVSVLLGIAGTAGADSLVDGDPKNLLNLETFAGGFTCSAGACGPVAFAFLPDGRVIVVLKDGNISLVSADGKQKSDAGKFTVSNSNNEKGLLNVLPHPDFNTNKQLFFYLSDPGGKESMVVSAVLGADNKVDTAGRKVVLRGFAGPENHDGGALALSPDGKYLYVGVGDSGCNGGNFLGTCLTTLNGKILRLNLDGSAAAGNPLENETAVSSCDPSCRVADAPDCGCVSKAPSATGAPRKEIWAWGLRNPWRIWTDPKTGNLWVGDVGETDDEEIDVIAPAGGVHMGFPWREGLEDYKGTSSKCTEIQPNKGNCVNPVYACDGGNDPGKQDAGCNSITGGVIIDSCKWPEALRNRYYFGDYAASRVYSLKLSDDRKNITGGRADVINNDGGNNGPVHFAVGPDGNLYYSTLDEDAIVKISPKSPIDCQEPIGGSGGSAGSSGGGNATGGTGTGGSSSATGGSATTGGTSASGGVSGKGGSSGARGNPADPNESGDEGSCSCRVAGSKANTLLAILTGVVAAAALSRRRRR